MTSSVLGFGLLVVLTVAVLVYWKVAVLQHRRRLDQLAVRVHVNGIRGKSTVTRLIAGVLREGGYVTVAKTTGSAARVIGPEGEETPIFRRGAATINEQIDIVERHVVPDVEALVIECMAVRPLYQQYSQDYMVRSDITVITNVREDHQEEMGESLEEIANSLAVTSPQRGTVITAEDRPHLRARLADHASARGSSLTYADPAVIDDEDMSGFDYLQFKENVAIGLAVAKELGISREAAIRGMWKSVPDVGVVRLRYYPVRDKRVLWVPLFAANDRESVVRTFENLDAQFPAGAPRIGILNNRIDRGRRAELFARLVPEDLRGYLDHVITFGAYEDQVISQMVEPGYPRDRIHRMGESVEPSLEDILDLIESLIPGRTAVLIGMVNIHTAQAEMLIEYFHELAGEGAVDELAESRQIDRIARPVQRLREAGTRGASRA